MRSSQLKPVLTSARNHPLTYNPGAESSYEAQFGVLPTAHDFNNVQPDHKVSDQTIIVYFARFILHDHSDKYAGQIVQALAQSMRPQDRLILNEVVVPDVGETPREIERRLQYVLIDTYLETLNTDCFVTAIGIFSCS